jgi:hypothetical protein
MIPFRYRIAFARRAMQIMPLGRLQRSVEVLKIRFLLGLGRWGLSVCNFRCSTAYRVGPIGNPSLARLIYRSRFH